MARRIPLGYMVVKSFHLWGNSYIQGELIDLGEIKSEERLDTLFSAGILEVVYKHVDKHSVFYTRTGRRDHQYDGLWPAGELTSIRPTSRVSDVEALGPIIINFSRYRVFSWKTTFIPDPTFVVLPAIDTESIASTASVSSVEFGLSIFVDLDPVLVFPQVSDVTFSSTNTGLLTGVINNPIVNPVTTQKIVWVTPAQQQTIYLAVNDIEVVKGAGVESISSTAVVGEITIAQSAESELESIASTASVSDIDFVKQIEPDSITSTALVSGVMTSTALAVFAQSVTSQATISDVGAVKLRSVTGISPSSQVGNLLVFSSIIISPDSTVAWSYVSDVSFALSQQVSVSPVEATAVVSDVSYATSIVIAAVSVPRVADGVENVSITKIADVDSVPSVSSVSNVVGLTSVIVDPTSIGSTASVSGLFIAGAAIITSVGIPSTSTVSSISVMVPTAVDVTSVSSTASVADVTYNKSKIVQTTSAVNAAIVSDVVVIQPILVVLQPRAPTSTVTDIAVTKIALQVSLSSTASVSNVFVVVAPKINTVSISSTATVADVSWEKSQREPTEVDVTSTATTMSLSDPSWEGTELVRVSLYPTGHSGNPTATTPLENSYGPPNDLWTTKPTASWRVRWTFTIPMGDRPGTVFETTDDIQTVTMLARKVGTGGQNPLLRYMRYFQNNTLKYTDGTKTALTEINSQPDGLEIVRTFSTADGNLNDFSNLCIDTQYNKRGKNTALRVAEMDWIRWDAVYRLRWPL